MTQLLPRCAVSRTVAPTLFLTAALAAVTGCGRSNEIQLTEAKGLVTHKGKPLECGVVVLESRATGFSACGVIQPDGTFTIGKVVAGEYLVAVMAPELPAPGSGVPPTFVSEDNRKLFNKYSNAEKSGLKVAVAADGNNDLRFDLP